MFVRTFLGMSKRFFHGYSKVLTCSSFYFWNCFCCSPSGSPICIKWIRRALHEHYSEGLLLQNNGFTTSLNTDVYQHVLGLPPWPAPTAFWPQLHADASMIEDMIMVYSDSMSPTLNCTQENSFQRWELYLSLTEASSLCFWVTWFSWLYQVNLVIFMKQDKAGMKVWGHSSLPVKTGMLPSSNGRNLALIVKWWKKKAWDWQTDQGQWQQCYSHCSFMWWWSRSSVFFSQYTVYIQIERSQLRWFEPGDPGPTGEIISNSWSGNIWGFPRRSNLLLEMKTSELTFSSWCHDDTHQKNQKKSEWMN